MSNPAQSIMASPSSSLVAVVTPVATERRRVAKAVMTLATVVVMTSCFSPSGPPRALQQSPGYRHEVEDEVVPELGELRKSMGGRVARTGDRGP